MNCLTSKTSAVGAGGVVAGLGLAAQRRYKSRLTGFHRRAAAWRDNRDGNQVFRVPQTDRATKSGEVTDSQQFEERNCRVGLASAWMRRHIGGFRRFESGATKTRLFCDTIATGDIGEVRCSTSGEGTFGWASRRAAPTSTPSPHLEPVSNRDRFF